MEARVRGVSPSAPMAAARSSAVWVARTSGLIHRPSSRSGLWAATMAPTPADFVTTVGGEETGIVFDAVLVRRNRGPVPHQQQVHSAVSVRLSTTAVAALQASMTSITVVGAAPDETPLNRCTPAVIGKGSKQAVSVHMGARGS